MKIKRAMLIVSFVIAYGPVNLAEAYFIGDHYGGSAEGYPKIHRIDVPSKVLPGRSFRVEIFAQRALGDHILGGFLHMGSVSGDGAAWLDSPDCLQIGDEV